MIRFLMMVALLVAGSVWLRPRRSESIQPGVRFEERAAPAGCQNVHSMVRLAPEFENIMPWLSSVGAAAAAGDFDGDGFADLYVTNSGRGDGNRLFRNRGDGTFEEVTSRAGVGCGNPEGGSMHAVWGDVDNDGDLDLYITKWAEPNALFLNDGNGVFIEMAASSGVDFWGYGNAATFLDYDRDGWLDLLVGNYFADRVVDPGSGQPVRNDLWNPVTTRIMHETFTHADNGGRNVLYRNLGGGTPRFEDVTESVGMTFTGWTLAVGSGDLNNDGWPDVYIANDFGPDELYLNTGATESSPRFRLVVDPRGHPGVGNDWWKGMNVDMGDVNNDGYLDIYVTNILERRYKTDEGNMLWLNCLDPMCPGGRGFRNIAEPSATNDGGWGWGGKFADFNNDGLLDIFTVNGFVTGDPQQNYWFAIQEMVTQTKNQTADARDWPVMGTRDLSGRERARLFLQIPNVFEASNPIDHRSPLPGAGRTTPDDPRSTKSSTPRFIEAAQASGISDTYNGRGIAVADFNHDGYLDLYVANQGAPSCYYVNRTGHRIENRGGAEDSSRGRGPEGSAERVSLDGGTNSRPRPSDPAFLRLKLVGRPDRPLLIGGRRLASTADAVGARITLWSRNGERQIREVQGGMGFASQSEHTVHFGIPDPGVLDRLTIDWPSGRVQEFQGDALRDLLNRQVRIVEECGAVNGT